MKNLNKIFSVILYLCISYLFLYFIPDTNVFKSLEGRFIIEYKLYYAFIYNIGLSIYNILNNFKNKKEITILISIVSIFSLVVIVFSENISEYILFNIKIMKNIYLLNGVLLGSIILNKAKN